MAKFTIREKYEIARDLYRTIGLPIVKKIPHKIDRFPIVKKIANERIIKYSGAKSFVASC